ncbi:tripartite tricarboxylate transporter substrate binding protein [Roseomonas sp. AR75]|uniref:Bug family tripartite tricarboxylate transporter substrate binding protein n=1 Tax=Roseomonas sp. AR75 TaxID=2562311 RepID=UPI001484EA13|nr:tripartite tricarboxylate transporter substrate-binding protein [Roseomonas sp. AR75]
MIRTITRRAALAAAALSLARPALAQGGRPIRLIVPFTPGGSSDLVARLLAPRLSEKLGQGVVVENRAGAAATIGTDQVAKAEPDGLTLLISTAAGNGLAPAVYPRLPYDPVADFTHIGFIGALPATLLVKPALGTPDFARFVAHARGVAQPIPYGTGGHGTLNHVTGELIALRTGAKLQHVPYRGSAQAMADLLGGTLQAVVDALPQNLPAIRDGRLVALGVTTRTRAAVAPDIPTFVEQGFPDIVAENWNGLSGPRGLAPATVQRIDAALRAVLAEPAIATQLTAWGMVPGPETPAAFTAFVAAEVARWRPVVQAAGAVQG